MDFEYRRQLPLARGLCGTTPFTFWSVETEWTRVAVATPVKTKRGWAVRARERSGSAKKSRHKGMVCAGVKTPEFRSPLFATLGPRREL